MTKTDSSPTHPVAPGNARHPSLPLAAGATAFGLCCGLPLLGSLGVAGAIVGLSASSWIAVTVAAVVAVIGARRWLHQRTCHTHIATTDRSPVPVVAAGSTAPGQGSQR